MGIEGFTSEILAAYTGFLSVLPPFFQIFFNFFFIAVLIFLYSLFVWELHKFISTKNILELNLKKYSKVEHPVLAKLTAGGLYFLEYAIIMPCLIFFWFFIFSIFMIIFTDLDLNFILLVSTVIIASIRMTAYYKEAPAKEIAKLIPWTLLSISLLTPGFFNFERIITNLNQAPQFFSVILNYLLFIIVLELILRFFEFVLSLTGLESD